MLQHIYGISAANSEFAEPSTTGSALNRTWDWRRGASATNRQHLLRRRWSQAAPRSILLRSCTARRAMESRLGRRTSRSFHPAIENASVYTYRDSAAASCDIVNESRAHSKRWRGAVKLTENALLVELAGGVLPRIGNDMWASRRMGGRPLSFAQKWTAARAPRSRCRPGSVRSRYLFRLANKESTRSGQHESLLNAVVGPVRSPGFGPSERPSAPGGGIDEPGGRVLAGCG